MEVYVLSYDAGILGVFGKKTDALTEKATLEPYDYKGLKVQTMILR